MVRLFFTFFFCCIITLLGGSTNITVQAQESAILQKGGIITGVVKAPWVQYNRAFVYINHVEGEFPPSKEMPFISQRNLNLDPHILPVLKGTKVDFSNDDFVVHNIYSPPESPNPFDLELYGMGVRKFKTFDDLGVVSLHCVIHPNMSGFVIVLQNPYFAMTDKRGNFEIKDVPPGTYQLKVWHEELVEASQQVIVEAGKTISVQFTDLKEWE